MWRVTTSVNRILLIADVSGVWITLLVSAIGTALALFAFVYRIEFAQAVFLLVCPMAILSLLSVRTARIIRHDGLEGAELVKRLLRHRFATQGIGVISIFVTAMYGMWVNLWVGPFGGF